MGQNLGGAHNTQPGMNFQKLNPPQRDLPYGGSTWTFSFRLEIMLRNMFIYPAQEW